MGEDVATDDENDDRRRDFTLCRRLHNEEGPGGQSGMTKRSS
jgi:hypothetical protein